MIVPMIKYGFLVYHRDFDSFLLRLQELGMVDIGQSRTISDGERSLIAGLYVIIKQLRTFNPSSTGRSREGRGSGAVLAAYESLVKEGTGREFDS